MKLPMSTKRVECICTFFPNERVQSFYGLVRETRLYQLTVSGVLTLPLPFVLFWRSAKAVMSTRQPVKPQSTSCILIPKPESIGSIRPLFLSDFKRCGSYRNY
jgi:hypothetical protein